MESEKINLTLPVAIYGKMEKYNDTISKARCRIFYKYGNRNGTYITDEFANKLLTTVTYAPVKGIYNFEEKDYEDHGVNRTQGRIYGIVPANANFAWETHLDEDGVERVYACVDVLLYTGIYKEAAEIVGKSQSMELYDKTIRGEWQYIDGERYFVFTEGSFLGLQALGDDVEPCFEGASFYSLIEPIMQLVKEYDNFQNQGGHKMKINFKLSDDQKFETLWTLLNTNYTEDGGWEVDCAICAVYDNYAVVRNYAEDCYERVYYIKDDSTDSVTISNRERCYIVDVSENEKKSLEVLQSLNGGTYEKADETFAAQKEQIEDLTNDKVSFEQKIEELNESLSTLTTERDEANTLVNALNTRVAELNEQVDTLTNENTALHSFKTETERQEKTAIISKYSLKLPSEIVEKYSSELDKYTAEDLKKQLAYELVENNPSVFTNDPQTGYVPKDEPKSGIEAILSRYNK